jgi:hypothetical protein
MCLGWPAGVLHDEIQDGRAKGSSPTCCRHCNTSALTSREIVLRHAQLREQLRLRRTRQRCKRAWL